MKLTAIIVAILVVLGGGAWLLVKNKKTPAPATSSTPASQTTQPTQPATTNNSSNQPANSANVITYDGNGFSPSTLTVKKGDTVTIKNTSSKDMQFDSDPHPVHTDDPELNVGTVAPGESQTFTVTTTGTHGYHNHLDSSQTGTIIVQ